MGVSVDRPRRGRHDRPDPADGRDPRRALEAPGQDAALAHRPARRRPRHRPREDQGAPRRRRGDAAVPQGPPRLLRRARPRRPRGCRRAPSARRRPAAWTPTSSSSRPRAARWSCSPRATAASRSPTRARPTAASTSARSAARPPGSPRTASSSVEVLEYPELGMEAIWKIEVEDFPAFVVVDDKGNDFFAAVTKPVAFTIEKRAGLDMTGPDDPGRLRRTSLAANEEFAADLRPRRLRRRRARRHRHRHLHGLAASTHSRMLGLHPGDAKIFRNPGGRVTPAGARGPRPRRAPARTSSASSSCRTPGAPWPRSTEDELRERVGASAGGRRVVAELRRRRRPGGARSAMTSRRSATHPLIGERARVGGFVYDVDTGLLQPASCERPARGAGPPPGQEHRDPSGPPGHRRGLGPARRPPVDARPARRRVPHRARGPPAVRRSPPTPRTPTRRSSAPCACARTGTTTCSSTQPRGEPVPVTVHGRPLTGTEATGARRLAAGRPRPRRPAPGARRRPASAQPGPRPPR